MVELAKEFAAEPGTYFTNQFHNRDSLAGYRKVGKELLDQLDQPPDAFCAAAGTAGLVMGVAGALADAGCPTRIFVAEPASSAVISGGEPGVHGVEGIGVGFIPPLLDGDLFNEVVAVEEADARQMARQLAREEGLLAGTSSGLNVACAVAVAAELGPGHTVATVAVDTGLKYLSGDLFAE
jgi:cysteine synthase A